MTASALATWSAAGLFLVSLLGGVAVRAHPYLTNSTDDLGDLDPHRYARGVNNLLTTDRFGGVDTLSAAPNGTTATYSVTHGYYFLIAAAVDLSGLPLQTLMSPSPLFFFALFAAALFWAGSRLLGGPVYGAIATVLYAFSPSYWGLIPFIATNPVAEEVGFVLAPIFLAFCHEAVARGSVRAGAGAIGLGVAISAYHPSTFFFVAGPAGLAALLYLLARRVQLRAIAIRILAIFGPMAVLVLLLAATDLGTGGRLSQHSLFMSRVGGSFYRADAATTFAELGVLAGMLAAAGAVLALRQENHAALVGCSGLVFCLGVIGLAWFGAAQSLFSGTQIGTFLNFSHRTLYYLPLYGALAGALTLKTGIQYVERLPSWRPLLKRAAHAGLVALVLVLLVVTRLPRQEAGMKAFEAIEPESQAELYQWITQNNKQSAVFATNYLDLDQWLRYYPRARSVLSASMEDIAAPDFMTRIELYSLLFSRGNTPDSDRLDALLDTYGVGYVVVNRAPFYFDLGQNQLVNRIPDNASYQFYLTSFQASPFFEEAWRSASGDTVVYEVTRDG